MICKVMLSTRLSIQTIRLPQLQLHAGSLSSTDLRLRATSPEMMYSR